MIDFERNDRFNMLVHLDRDLIAVKFKGQGNSEISQSQDEFTEGKHVCLHYACTIYDAGLKADLSFKR